jgi:uncharacterized hydrophobic protein (TIGR00271 family)
MVHLRIVAPPDRAAAALDLLCKTPSVTNVIHLEGVARRPVGDVILCDVAREDASVVLSDLRELEIDHEGSIALEVIDAQISDVAALAEKEAKGAPADAVVWEEVESRTSENVELSAVYVLFMVLAAQIASVGIYLDSAILVVGAMVVGPEFGPIAGICVALVQKRPELAKRSAAALVAGFVLAIALVVGSSLVFKATGITPDTFSEADHSLAASIANPDFFAAFVAVCAGTAGMLSLSTAKSGALIGVLISVTTIPAASNVGVSAAYGDWDSFWGSLGQLGINLAGILVAGSLTLLAQRLLYRKRRLAHLRDPARELAGLPVGRSRHSKVSGDPVRRGTVRR